MYLPFEHILSCDPKEAYFRRKRLSKKNPYNLAAGIYLIHDIYPINPLAGSDLYFNVERASNHELLLTARFDLSQQTLSLSTRHLQSPEAPQVLTYLKTILDQEANHLEQRVHEVIQMYVFQMLHMEELAPEDYLINLQRLLAMRSKNTLADIMLQILDQVQAVHEQKAKEPESNLILFRAPQKSNQHKQSQNTGSVILRVDLKHTKPKIWRRLQIPANLTLSQVHEVLQIAMGWHNCHLWQFIDGRRNMYLYSDEAFDSSLNLPKDLLSFMGSDFGEELNPDDYQIGDFLQQSGDWLDYEYDFGDSWEHRLKLEKYSTEAGVPKLLKAVNACPPEDCGGVWGYDEILETLQKKRKNANDKELIEWLGTGFDPGSVDLEDINRRLKHLFS